QAFVKASNSESQDNFGQSVALSADGNTLAVGASRESGANPGVVPGPVSELTAGNGASSAGAVYVFTHSAGVWSQHAYVKASNPESIDFFGSTVALSGDGNTLAVGAPGEDSAVTGPVPGSPNEATVPNGAPASGAVYVFTRSGSTWIQEYYLKASN